MWCYSGWDVLAEQLTPTWGEDIERKIGRERDGIQHSNRRGEIR